MATRSAEQWFTICSEDYRSRRICGHSTKEAHDRMSQEIQFLFGFITERIYSKTEKGRALMNDILLACQEGTLLMSSGTRPC